MNILIITAHPTSRNLTSEIAKIYKNEKESRGNSVEIVDLYHDERQPFYTFEDAHDTTLTDVQKYYQQKIKNADEIVFVYPFWWGGVPAILKNWIDWNLTKDFAFYYANSRPKGLLQSKSVKVFSTCGAPKLYYIFTGVHFATKKIWKQTIVEFCGMKFDGYYLFGGVDTSGEKVDEIFEKIKEIAKN